MGMKPRKQPIDPTVIVAKNLCDRMLNLLNGHGNAEVLSALALCGAICCDQLKLPREILCESVLAAENTEVKLNG